MLYTGRSRMALALIPFGLLTAPPAPEPTHDGKPLSHWVRQFERGGDDAWPAADAIGAIGPPAASVVPILVKALKDDHYWIARPLARIGVAAVPALKEALRHGDPSVRARAAEALEQMGPEGRTAVPALVARLRDKDARVRGAAACALMALAPDAEAAIPALIAALGSEDEAVRFWAAGALGRIGAKAKAAVPALAAALGSPEETLRRQAVMALGGIGPEAKSAIPQLGVAINDEEWKVRYAATSALVRIGEPALPALREALRDEETVDRGWVFLALRRLGAPAVPVLVEALRGPEDRRERALYSLGEIGPDAKAAVAALLRYLKTEQGPTRLSAAASLWRIARHRAALDALRKALADKDWDVRFAAAETAAELGVEGKYAAPVLAEALGRDRFTRESALHGLFRSRDARAAVPAVVQLLERKHAEDRASAAQLLGWIGSADGVDALVRALQDEDVNVREAGARALGMIGPKAKAAVPGLVALSTKEADPARVAAAEALWRIGKRKGVLPGLVVALNGDDFAAVQAAKFLGSLGAAAKEAVPALIAALEREDSLGIVRAASARALGNIGPPARAAVPALTRLLSSVPSNARLAAAEALWRIQREPKVVRVLCRAILESGSRDKAAEILGRIGPKAKDAVPTLIYALRDLDDYTLRPQAARALGRMGAEARPALPYLKDALHDEYPEVRRAAAEAIRAIDPPATRPKAPNGL
jgi:HEAT repeat protein